MTPGELLREARRRHGVRSSSRRARIERDLVWPRVSTLATLLDLLGQELDRARGELDYGHDRTLIRRNLEMSLGERLQHGADFVLRNRGAARRAS